MTDAARTSASICSPPPTPSQDEGDHEQASASTANAPPPDALIREARRRQRRRRAIVAVAVLLSGALAVFAVRQGDGSGSRQPHGQAKPGAPSPSTPSTRAAAPPLHGLDRPHSLAVDRDGNLFIADWGTNQIKRRHPDGSLDVFAGNGEAGFSGDGGPAIDAEINFPRGIAVAADGTAYFADVMNNRVRAVSPSGTISTVAGTGVFGSSGDGGPAAAAQLSNPLAVAVAPDGTLYIAEGDRVRHIATDGTISTAVLGGPGALPLPGGPTYFGPSAVAVDGSGNIYVSNISPKLLVQFSPNGQILKVWDPYYVTPAGLVGTPEGVVIANYGFTIDRITNGELTTLLPASRGLAFRPSGVAVGPNGEIYAADDGASGGGVQLLLVIDPSGEARLLATG